MNKDMENMPQQAEQETKEELTAEQINTEETKEEEISEEAKEDAEDKRVVELQEKVEDLKEKNLRMMAEYENYRRRTAREKMELRESANADIMRDMLPLVDDFERGLEALDKSEDIESLREGVRLIYQKFTSFLSSHGVEVIETEDKDFDTAEHEAVTLFAAGEDKKGKVIDCVQKGYKMGEKVIRYAKVVVGE